MEIEDEMMIDDYQEILDIINFGFHRRRYQRSEYFDEMDNYSFFWRIRLTKPTVLDILGRIEEELETSIGDFIGIHQSAVSRVVTKVIDAIARLRLQFVYMPTARDILQIHTDFHNIGGFPKVLGCIDGTHIKFNHQVRFINFENLVNIIFYFKTFLQLLFTVEI